MQADSTTVHIVAPLTVLGFRDIGYKTFVEVVERSMQGTYAEGHSARVYQIPGTDKYVLRALKTATIEQMLGQPLELVPDPLPSRNISQLVARQGSFEIRRRQKGITAGVSYKDYVHPGPNGDSAYRNYIELLSGLDQKAFDHLAETMVALPKAGYYFDYSQARNLMIDVEGCEINVVDVAPARVTLHLGYMLPPLLDTIYRYRTSCKFEELRPQIQLVIDKSVQAALKAGLPIPAVLGEATKFEEHARMEYVFELVGKKGGWPQARAAILAGVESRRCSESKQNA